MAPREHSLQELVRATDTKGLHVIPSVPELSGFEVNAAGEIGRENRLKRALSSLGQRFDVVVLDECSQMVEPLSAVPLLRAGAR